jgi:hypothetical protein
MILLWMSRSDKRGVNFNGRTRLILFSGQDCSHGARALRKGNNRGVALLKAQP